MRNIKVTFRDGTSKDFRHTGRPGGSYTKNVRLEPGWVVIIDEYGGETAYPSDLVQEVESQELGLGY